MVDFYLIINPPEVAILGLSKTYQKPYLSSSKSLKEKEVLPVSLSYDHRLINGVYGAQFVTSLDAILQDTKLFENMTDRNFKDGCVFVIGGTGVVGSACVKSFHEAGANVAFSYNQIRGSKNRRCA